ncbi:MAG: MMPL family transporter [Propionibacteriaceae bacterium]|nr:MMPL family transporter [Propionibacteriaceae bacterium]
MSSFLYRLARSCFRHRKQVVLVWGLILAVLGLGALASPKQFDDGFSIPGAASQVALERLAVTFPDAADSSAQLILTAPDGTRLDDPAVKGQVERYFAQLENAGYVKGVTSPYLEQVSGQISDDGKYALASIRVFGGVSAFSDADRADLVDRAEKISDFLPGATANVGGSVFSIHMPEFTWVESLGLIVAVVVLVLTLGSVFGMTVPLATALTGVGCGFSVVTLDASLMSVSATTLILAVMLGLAVGIDYSLFIVARHRDQLATGLGVEESAARAVGTAGSAVIFAGMTVIIALIGLSIANLPFLTIMGCLSAATVAFMVCLAISLVPALLGFFGERLRPKAARTSRRRGWNPATWWVKAVTRWPLLPCLLVVAGLGALSLPTTHLELALPDSGQSAPGELDRITFDMISEHFGVGYNGPLVVTADIVESTDPMGVADGLKAEIEAMPGVKLVPMATPNANADTVLVQVIPTTAPDDPATTELVHQLAGKAPEWKQRYDVDTAVTGFTAATIDVTNRLRDSMLPFALFVVGLSFLLLMMVFRSVWVPLKAALGYLLSVGGAFGATALVFNDGYFTWLINLVETRPVISFLPIFGMGILFGLAMDYEVFLTSRMREEYVHGNPNYIVDGFTHSAKVVVAAGVIMFAVFVFFVPASGGMVKPIAFCLAVGVALDAFLVRMTLGPAVMKLLGDSAWWLPKWLDRIMPTLDVEGEAVSRQLSVRASFGDDPAPVSARGLTATVGGRTLFAGLDLEVPDGGVLVVEGGADARKALLYGLSGHVPFSGGTACVAGSVLGGESAVIRRRTLLLGPADDLSRALPGTAKVVLVDGADSLDSNSRQALRDAMRESSAVWILAGPSGWASDRVVAGPHGLLRLDEERLGTPAVGGSDE